MFIVWKGQGWWLLVIMLGVSALLLPFEWAFKMWRINADLLEGACLFGLIGATTQGVASWLERRDRAREKDLDENAAKALHSVYGVSLSNWGYIALLLSSGLFITLWLSMSLT